MIGEGKLPDAAKCKTALFVVRRKKKERKKRKETWHLTANLLDQSRCRMAPFGTYVSIYIPLYSGGSNSTIQRGGARRALGVVAAPRALAFRDDRFTTRIAQGVATRQHHAPPRVAVEQFVAQRAPGFETRTEGGVSVP